MLAVAALAPASGLVMPTAAHAARASRMAPPVMQVREQTGSIAAAFRGRVVPTAIAAAPTVAATYPVPLMELLEEKQFGPFFGRVSRNPKQIFPLLRDAGVYGILAYAIVFVAFYTTAAVHAGPPTARTLCPATCPDRPSTPFTPATPAPAPRPRPTFTPTAGVPCRALLLRVRLREHHLQSRLRQQVIAEAGYHVVSGGWFDPRPLLQEDGADGKAEALAGFAAFYLACKPFGPVKLGGALVLTPDVRRVVQRFPALLAAVEAAGAVGARASVALAPVREAVAPLTSHDLP